MHQVIQPNSIECVSLLFNQSLQLKYAAKGLFLVNIINAIINTVND